ncbi:MAG TPA: hypothetical protein VIK86_06915 [Candidatus Paceibacterota bacterium]
MNTNHKIKIGDNMILNLDEIKKGDKVMQRQNALQYEEGRWITITCRYGGLGYDYKYGKDVHVSVYEVNVKNKIVDHIWIRYAALVNPYIWKMLNIGENITLYGRVYSYVSTDKKYSLELRSIYSANIGTYYINMDYVYNTMIYSS